MSYELLDVELKIGQYLEVVDDNDKTQRGILIDMRGDKVSIATKGLVSLPRKFFLPLNNVHHKNPQDNRNVYWNYSKNHYCIRLNGYGPHIRIGSVMGHDENDIYVKLNL